MSNPNKPEDRRKEITKKEKGKGLETDGMKVVGSEEKRGITVKEQEKNTKAVRTKQKSPTKTAGFPGGKAGTSTIFTNEVTAGMATTVQFVVLHQRSSDETT